MATGIWWASSNLPVSPPLIRRVTGSAGPFAEPGFQDGPCGGQQRGASFFPALAGGVHFGTGAERDVLAGERG